MYKLHTSPLGNDFIILVSKGTIIPFNEQNSDYQEYLKWLEEGNTPLPADTQE